MVSTDSTSKILRWSQQSTSRLYNGRHLEKHISQRRAPPFPTKQMTKTGKLETWMAAGEHFTSYFSDDSTSYFEVQKLLKNITLSHDSVDFNKSPPSKSHRRMTCFQQYTGLTEEYKSYTTNYHPEAPRKMDPLKTTQQTMKNCNRWPHWGAPHILPQNWKHTTLQLWPLIRTSSFPASNLSMSTN